MWEKERQKLLMYYGGIVDIDRKPDALFIVDTHLENLAVREANRTGVKVVGIVDTNADPDNIDYVIPANDDAVGSLELIISYIMDAWLEGRQQMDEKKKEEEKAQEEKAEMPEEEKKTPKKVATKKTKEKKEKAA